jgi:two-component system, chemotaxis family, chemotaxis protein CheY
MAIMKILIVDDMTVARRILKSCISRAEDYEFHEAEDGVKGLEAYRNIRPDLTFMDINMPNMDGMDCLEQIIKVNPKAVVVMCSSEINPESIQKATSLGAFSTIVKPPTRDSLLQVLAKVQDRLGCPS